MEKATGDAERKDMYPMRGVENMTRIIAEAGIALTSAEAIPVAASFKGTVNSSISAAVDKQGGRPHKTLRKGQHATGERFYSLADQREIVADSIRRWTRQERNVREFSPLTEQWVAEALRRLEGVDHVSLLG